MLGEEATAKWPCGSHAIASNRQHRTHTKYRLPLPHCNVGLLRCGHFQHVWCKHTHVWCDLCRRSDKEPATENPAGKLLLPGSASQQLEDGGIKVFNPPHTVTFLLQLHNETTRSRITFPSPPLTCECRPNTARSLASNLSKADSSGSSLLNAPHFDPESFLKRLLKESRLGELTVRHRELLADVGALDSDMQMLVYENYNKFITATDIIKLMNGAMEGMDDRMHGLKAQIGGGGSGRQGANICPPSAHSLDHSGQWEMDDCIFKASPAQIVSSTSAATCRDTRSCSHK
jgi:hypothetical protein